MSQRVKASELFKLLQEVVTEAGDPYIDILLIEKESGLFVFKRVVGDSAVQDGC